MSYAVIEVDADSKEEAKQKVKDMSESEIDDEGQLRRTCDFIEINEVEEVKTTQAKL